MRQRLFSGVNPSRAEVFEKAGGSFQKLIEVLEEFPAKQVVTSTEGRIFILGPAKEEQRGSIDALMSILSQASAAQFNALEGLEAGTNVPKEKLEELLKRWCQNGCVIKIIGWPPLSKGHIVAKLMGSYPAERLVDKWSRLFGGLEALASKEGKLAIYSSLVLQHIIPTLIFDVGETPVIVQPRALPLREIPMRKEFSQSQRDSILQQARALLQAMLSIGPSLRNQVGLMLDPLGTDGTLVALRIAARLKTGLTAGPDLEVGIYSNFGVLLEGDGQSPRALGESRQEERRPRVVIFDPIAWDIPQNGGSLGRFRAFMSTVSWHIQEALASRSRERHNP